MKKLALTLPGSYSINSLSPNFTGSNLGYLVTQALSLTFLIASVLMFFWGIWGVFEYIFGGGDKERLSKARGRITWAIVGFIIVAISFAVSQYVKEFFPPQPVNTINVSTPRP